MTYYLFGHNFGNGNTMKQWGIKDHSPRWYITREHFKDGSVRIVASAGDIWTNTCKSIKEARKFINNAIKSEVGQ